MNKIRGNTVGTPMKPLVPKVTNEDNGKFLRVVDGVWCAAEIAEGELGEHLASYSDEVTVDEGASATFASNYEEGYAEGYEQGQREGGGITEDWVRENFLPIRTYDSTKATEAVIGLTPEGNTKIIFVSNGFKPDALVKRESDGDIILGTKVGEYSSSDKNERIAVPKFYVDGIVGDIEKALDNIIALQESLVGGVSE